MAIYIDDVIKEDAGNGQHVIKSVCWTTDFYSKANNWCSKKEMIDYMQTYNYVSVKTKYRGYGGWIMGEDVRVVDGRYLRTDANETPCDNLGNL